MYYMMFYLIGIIAASLSTPSVTKDALTVIGPITLTVFFASLMQPFAAFAKTEHGHKFCLKYAVVPLFGAYTAVFIQEKSWVGLIFLACASGVHVAYWMSSIQSRQYRLGQFQLGFAAQMPATSRFIAMLNGRGRSNEGDEIISAILNGETVDEIRLEALFDSLKKPGLLHRVAREIQSGGNSPPV